MPKDHGGHSTTTIRRPADATASRTRPVERTDDSLFGDLTRPIPQDKRLVQGRGKRSLIALGALVLTMAVVAAFFVLPVKAWLRQEDEIERKEQVATALEQENASMTREIDQLQTPEGIEEAAREVIGFVRAAEIRLTVLPGTDAPPTLPGGWPYDQMAQIVAVRAADAAQA